MKTSDLIVSYGRDDAGWSRETFQSTYSLQITGTNKTGIY